MFDSRMTIGPELPQNHEGPLVIANIEGRGLMMGYCYDPKNAQWATGAHEFLAATLQDMHMAADFDDPLVISYAGKGQANMFVYYPIVYGGQVDLEKCKPDRITEQFINHFYNRPGSSLMADILLRDPS